MSEYVLLELFYGGTLKKARYTANSLDEAKYLAEQMRINRNSSLSLYEIEGKEMIYVSTKNSQTKQWAD